MWEASGPPYRGLVGEGLAAWCTRHSGLSQGTFVVVQPRASCSLLLIFDRSGRGRGERIVSSSISGSVASCVAPCWGSSSGGAAFQLTCIDLIHNLIIFMDGAHQHETI